MDEREQRIFSTAIKEAAALARGDGLPVLHKICEKQKTVVTRKVESSVEITEDFMKRCAVVMRQTADAFTAATERAEKAESQRDRMREALKTAPHSASCAVHYEDTWDCTCWKRDTLKEVGDE